MQKVFLFFGLFISTHVFAVDPAITAANNQYFDILKRIQISGDKSRPLIERRMEFSNFANEFGDPGAHWQTLKIGVLEIIIADAAFWANEITQFPAIQEKLIRDFSMDWFEESTSNYQQKLRLAKTELKRELENIEKQKLMLLELMSKLQNTRATTIE